MNKSEFVGLLNDLEWEDFEVREINKASLKNSLESVSAFSNTAGGWIVFGAKKTPGNYEVIGIPEPQGLKHEFSSLLKDAELNQKVNIKCIKYRLNRKILLAFYIPPSENKPVYFKSQENTFVRTSGGNRIATHEEIDTMLINTSLVEENTRSLNSTSVFKNDISFAKQNNTPLLCNEGIEPKEFKIDDVDLEKVKNQELHFRNIAPKRKQENIFQEKVAESKPITNYSKNLIKENSGYSGEVKIVNSLNNSCVLPENNSSEGDYSNGANDNYSGEPLEETPKDYSENIEKPVKDLRLENFNHKDILKGHIEGYTKEQIIEYKKDPKEAYKQDYPKKSENS
ncbi:MAG: hypothetical protein DRP06_01035 [Candidatus Aenigmatarchaeota archaeon]|nr:MAG: hypothetical protein DRP06_01035 [Candidatus Aenigmarchaeota archaeon]